MNATTAYAENEVRRRENGRLLQRARDRESLREIRAVLDRVYGRRAVETFRDRPA
jgi:hypothetical protein